MTYGVTFSTGSTFNVTPTEITNLVRQPTKELRTILSSSKRREASKVTSTAYHKTSIPVQTISMYALLQGRKRTSLLN